MSDPVTPDGALMYAARDELWARWGWTNKTCDVTPPGGQPPPWVDNYFVALHSGPAENLNSEHATFLHEAVAFAVTITKKNSVPYDRQAAEMLYRKQDCLSELANKVKIGIHRDCDHCAIINRANTMLGGLTENNFVVPVRYLNSEAMQPVNAQWFHAEQGEKSGWIQTLHFGRAERPQTLQEMA